MARLFAAAVAALQSLAVVSADPASAAPSCSFDSGTLTLVDDGAGVPLASVLAIHVTGGTGVALVDIWMSQVPAGASPFAALFSGGADGVDWGTISWTVDLSANIDVITPPVPSITPLSQIAILDASPTDPMDVTLGSLGIDLNGDGLVDVSTQGVNTFEVATADRRGSTVSAGGGGMGGPLGGSLIVGGGPGDDSIVGGDGQDVVIGGPGDDVISAGPGSDAVIGSAGDDRIEGGDGGDILIGGLGNDRIDGGNGRDRCRGGTGNDHLVACEIVR